MSCALVAGTAARLAEINPALTAEDIRAIIEGTVRPRTGPGRGRGDVDAGRAAQWAYASNPLSGVTSYPLIHGRVGAGSSQALSIQDSTVGLVLTTSGASGLRDSAYSVVRYHLVGQGTLGQLGSAVTWVRRAASFGMPLTGMWDQRANAWWGGSPAGTYVTGGNVPLETYVYRIAGLPSHPWYPCTPTQAFVSYTAIRNVEAPVSVGERSPRPHGVALIGRTVFGAGDVGFELSTSESAPVDVDIFDVAGRRIAHIWNGLPRGPLMRVKWDAAGSAGGSVPQGMYVCRAIQGASKATKRFIIVR
jgi:hypothetical protein